ncbi:MAG TPA: ribonuclease HII [Candidatus Copromonas avistercoris]|nr:ribonuclease HII [Candidatus Copromonas avistercoris]
MARVLTGERLEKELARLEAMKEFEREYDGCSLICGVDEAGRGPLAGPVAAGAVILPKDCTILYLNDSKKLSEKRREELFLEIREKAVSYSVGIVGPERIDEINILQATYEAMCQAVSGLGVVPDLLLNDAVTIPELAIPQVPIIKGDAKSVSIAAASILAKVTRDHLMEEYDRQFPQYGFAKHKGYGTAAHVAAIREFGPCPIHRRSFLKNILGENGK